MFDSMNDAATIVDLNANIVDVNEAAVRLHGYANREEMIGMPGADLIAERERESVVKYTMKAVDKGTTHERKECTLLKSDGTEFDAEMSFSVLYDKDGNLDSFLTLSQDITERKRAAQALEESEARFRALVNNMSSAVAVYEVKNKGKDFIFKDLNSAGEKISKLNKEDVLGKNLVDVFPNIKKGPIPPAMKRVWKTGKPEYIPPTLYRDDRITGWRENYIYKLPTGEVVAVYDDVTERIQAEEALRQSEEKLRLTFENMRDGITVTDLEGKIIEVNDVQLRMSGYSREEFIGRDGWDIIANIDRDRVINDVLKSLKGEAPEEGLKYRFVNKDGSEYDGELHVSVLRDSSGTPTGFITTVRDITERKRAEEAMRESEEKLRTMFESTNDSFIVTDVETTVIDVNEATLNTFGYSREELIGKKGFDLIAPEDLEKAMGPMSQALETGQPIDRMELSILCGDGRKLETDFSISALHDSSENVTGFVAAARDISERKRAEQAMRESEEKLRRMFESTSDGILVTDQALSILETNEAAARMLGFDSKEALVGQSAIPYMSTGAGGADDEGGDGKVQIEFSVSQLRDSEGNTTGFIGVARDVTERKKAEAQMKRMLEDLARSNAELEQFAYIASHDLQEPLRMISSYTQLIGRRYKDKLDADGEEFIEYAVDGATRMQDRIQALLTYSRVGTRGKEFEPIDCEDVLNEALSNLQVAIKKSEASITHDPLPTVPADGTQMVQLFQNLIENGIKFQDEKKPEVHVSAKEQDEEWLFSFRDNGIGIDPEYSDRIFLIFKKLHAKGEYAGTGVGLALCKKIVERHGGRIWVESELGKGATFYFTILKERKEED
jgi:PAS domain S-box-containing protein